MSKALPSSQVDTGVSPPDQENDDDKDDEEAEEEEMEEDFGVATSMMGDRIPRIGGSAVALVFWKIMTMLAMNIMMKIFTCKVQNLRMFYMKIIMRQICTCIVRTS